MPVTVKVTLDGDDDGGDEGDDVGGDEGDGGGDVDAEPCDASWDTGATGEHAARSRTPAASTRRLTLRVDEWFRFMRITYRQSRSVVGPVPIGTGVCAAAIVIDALEQYFRAPAEDRTNVLSGWSR
jgi:hypothetical protein